MISGAVGAREGGLCPSVFFSKQKLSLRYTFWIQAKNSNLSFYVTSSSVLPSRAVPHGSTHTQCGPGKARLCSVATNPGLICGPREMRTRSSRWFGAPRPRRGFRSGLLVLEDSMESVCVPVPLPRSPSPASAGSRVAPRQLASWCRSAGPHPRPCACSLR